MRRTARRVVALVAPILASLLAACAVRWPA